MPLAVETSLPAPIVINPPGSKVEEWLDKADVLWLGDDGQLVAPKDYHANLRFRLWLRELEAPGVDDKCLYRHNIIKRCEKDILFFFNVFLWTLDPRKRPADLPFITYGYEDDYIRWIQDHIEKGKDCLTEKSRDMGISWSALGVILHGWLFKKGYLAHLGSKKEDDVDRSGDIRSLFEKLRYLIDKLPGWIKPYGFEWKKHSMFMRLLNPMNNNAITGESSNRDFGRSGRYTCVLLDEFASMEYANEAWTATGDATPCRIAVSTPKGTGNKFWQMRFKSNIDIFTAHWTLHPEKAKDVMVVKTKEKCTPNHAYNCWRDGEGVTSSWYEAEKNRRLTDEKQSTVDIGQELDIDYLASGDPYFDVKALSKQAEWQVTEDWITSSDTAKKKLIVGSLTEIDGKIEFRPGKNGWLRLFEKPRAGGQYVGGIDPAEGLKHGDFSCAAFRDKKSRNLVAGVYGHFDYDELALFSHLASRYLNNCLVCAEAGGYGAAVNKRLYDLGANVARAVDISKGSITEKDKLGWINSTASRPQALADLEAEIREGACELRDKDLKNECLNFINANGKPQASEGSTDDYVWAFAIAGQLLRYRPYSEDLEKRQARTGKYAEPKPPLNMGFSFGKAKV